MPKDLNVLVISYYFPPYKRVGGRRWAKHCKYLNRFGIKMNVLAGAFPDSISSWDNDIKEYESSITRVKLNKVRPPYFKSKLPTSILNKVKWKLSLMYWNFKKKHLIGNYNDPSKSAIKDFLKTAKTIISKEKVNTIILTVGPFHYSDILLSLKKEFPEIKYVIDYRDRREYNLESLTDAQRLFEEEKQKKVLSSVDLIMSVNDFITEQLKSINPLCKTYTMPHCVDEEFLNIKIQQPKENGCIKFIYGGDLYGGLENEIFSFLDFMKDYEKISQFRCSADFYLTYSAYPSIFKNNSAVKVQPLLMLEDYQKKLSEADFILLFRPQWSLDSFSSKFFELLCLRKPILYFGAKGMVSEFLIGNNLGFHITSENISEISALLYQNRSTKKIPDINYDILRHSFEYQTKLLVEELVKL